MKTNIPTNEGLLLLEMKHYWWKYEALEILIRIEIYFTSQLSKSILALSTYAYIHMFSECVCLHVYMYVYG